MKLELIPKFQYFLNNEDELFLQDGENTYLKSPINDIYISLIEVEVLTGCSLIVLIWDKNKKEIVLPFDVPCLNVYNHTQEETKKLLKNIRKNLNCREINKYIEKEFEVIIDLIKIDEDLLNDKEVITLAQKHYKSMLPISLESPKISFTSEKMNNLLFQIKLTQDIEEAAYDFVESYMKENPKYLYECKQRLAAKKLLEYLLKKASKYRKTLNKVLNLVSSDIYKSLTISFETTEGEETTQNFKTNTHKIQKELPLFAITKIKYRGKVLFDRKKEISDAEWKYNKELWRYCFQDFYIRGVRPNDLFYECICPEIVKDEDMAFDLLSHFIPLKELSVYLPHTDNLIKRLLKLENSYNIYEKYYPEIYTKKEYAKILLDKKPFYYYFLSKELQEDEEIRNYYLIKEGK